MVGVGIVGWIFCWIRGGGPLADCCQACQAKGYAGNGSRQQPGQPGKRISREWEQTAAGQKDKQGMGADSSQASQAKG